MRIHRIPLLAARIRSAARGTTGRCSAATPWTSRGGGTSCLLPTAFCLLLPGSDRRASPRSLGHGRRAGGRALCADSNDVARRARAGGRRVLVRDAGDGHERGALYTREGFRTHGVVTARPQL